MLAGGAGERYVHVAQDDGGEIVLRGGGAQEIGIEHRGVADAADGAGEQLDEFGIVDDFGALRVGEEFAQRGEHFGLWRRARRSARRRAAGESSKPATRAPKPSVSRSPGSSVSQTAMGWSCGCAASGIRATAAGESRAA